MTTSTEASHWHSSAGGARRSLSCATSSASTTSCSAGCKPVSTKKSCASCGRTPSSETPQDNEPAKSEPQLDDEQIRAHSGGLMELKTPWRHKPEATVPVVPCRATAAPPDLPDPRGASFRCKPGAFICPRPPQA